MRNKTVSMTDLLTTFHSEVTDYKEEDRREGSYIFTKKSKNWSEKEHFALCGEAIKQQGTAELRSRRISCQHYKSLLTMQSWIPY